MDVGSGVSGEAGEALRAGGGAGARGAGRPGAGHSVPRFNPGFRLLHARVRPSQQTRAHAGPPAAPPLQGALGAGPAALHSSGQGSRPGPRAGDPWPPTPAPGAQAEGSRPWRSASILPTWRLQRRALCRRPRRPHTPAAHPSVGAFPSKHISGVRFIFTRASSTTKLGLRGAEGGSRPQTCFAQQTQGPAGSRARVPGTAAQGGPHSVVEGGGPPPSTREGR